MADRGLEAPKWAGAAVRAILPGVAPADADGNNSDCDLCELLADSDSDEEDDESPSRRARTFGTHACVYISMIRYQCTLSVSALTPSPPTLSYTGYKTPLVY